MIKWHNVDNLESFNYICGHCGADINSEEGYYTYEKSDIVFRENRWGYIYICHKCNMPTFISGDEQVPGIKVGKYFDKSIFNDLTVYTLYEEARSAYSINAFSSVGMCCRKLLMHIAVDCGAKENMKFIEYVNYLNDENYIPSNSKKWVDVIRNKGNDANHEIKILSKEEALQLLKFTEILITIIYEMPSSVIEIGG